MTTFQRLENLLSVWRERADNLDSDLIEIGAAINLCLDDFEKVISEIRNQRRRAGKIGGLKKSPSKTDSNRRNASRPRKKAAE